MLKEVEAMAAVSAAQIKIQSAIKDLADIVVHKCEGSDQMSESYFYAIKAIMNELIGIREKLK